MKPRSSSSIRRGTDDSSAEEAESKASTAPLRVAVAGIGGYASSHHAILSQLETAGAVSVVATCDPCLTEISPLCEQFDFASRKVRTWEGFNDMMAAHAAELDMVVIATPIHLHADMHEVCVNARIACYLEKPPTLDPQELERMIAADIQARKLTHVGFHFIHQKERFDLKLRMMNGEFGRLKCAGFLGLARRSPAYYQRNSWAGRLLLGDRLVLDSCFGNAFPHYLNNILFLSGLENASDWAWPEEIEAELYRVNSIESADTVFARGRLKSGSEFRIAASHACTDGETYLEQMEFELATVQIDATRNVIIRYPDGSTEQSLLPPASLLGNLSSYLDYLAGHRSRPVVRLEDCRSFVRLNALLYLAAPSIVSIPSRHIEPILLADDPVPTSAIRDIRAACEQLVSHGRFPSQAGFAWGKHGGRSRGERLSQFHEAIKDLQTSVQP